MNEDEIIRRNAAIALYMGWEHLRTNDDGHSDWLMPEGSNYPGMSRVYHGPLSFGTDWEALMPVVERIITEVGVEAYCKRDEFDPAIGGEFMFTLTPDHYASYSFSPLKGFGKAMIGAIWMAVSDYCLSQQSPS